MTPKPLSNPTHPIEIFILHAITYKGTPFPPHVSHWDRLFNGLHSILFRNDIQNGIDFLHALAKFTKRNLTIPLQSVEDIRPFYQRWKKSKNLFDVLNNVGRQLNIPHLPNSVWLNLLRCLPSNNPQSFKKDKYYQLLILSIKRAEERGFDLTNPMLFQRFNFYWDRFRTSLVMRDTSEENAVQRQIGRSTFLPLLLVRGCEENWPLHEHLTLLYEVTRRPETMPKITQNAVEILSTASLDNLSFFRGKALRSLCLLNDIQPKIVSGFLANLLTNSRLDEQVTLLFQSFKIPTPVIQNMFFGPDFLTAEEEQFCCDVLQGKSLRRINCPFWSMDISKGTVGFFYDYTPKNNFTLKQALLIASLQAKGIALRDAEFLVGRFMDWDQLTLFMELIPRVFILFSVPEDCMDVWDYLKFLNEQGQSLPSLRKENKRQLLLDLVAWESEHFPLLGSYKSRRKRKAWLRHLKITTFPIRESIPKFKKALSDGSVVFVSQIVDKMQLQIEGEKMKHCVFTYSKAIEEQRTFIYSMKLKPAPTAQNLEISHLLTIQVVGNNIVQVRGKENRSALDMEAVWVREWAQLSNLNYTALH